MLQTSGDALNLVLAIGVAVIIALIAWLFFTVLRTVRDVRGVTKAVREKIDMMDGLINLLKNKIESSANYVSILVELVSRLVTHFKGNNKTGEKRRPLRRRKKVKAEVED